MLDDHCRENIFVLFVCVCSPDVIEINDKEDIHLLSEYFHEAVSLL